MTPTRRSTRRRFVAQTLRIGAAAAAIPAVVPSSVLGLAEQPPPSEQIVIGVIGTGGRARQLIDHLPSAGRIVAVSDCYIRRMAETLQEKKQQWRTYQDYRSLLDREKLDAAIIATPDHTRTLAAVRAVLAGLDIYAEKPLTLTIAEGRTLVRHVRRAKRVFQVGSQQRSMELNRFACELVRSGEIGRVKLVQGVCYPGPKRYVGLPEEPVPEGDDWDAWQGQTSAKPFNNALQFGWMAWRDYSGGEMTNWGAHGCDQVQWALGASETGPIELWPITAGPNGKVGMRYANGVEVRYELERGPMGGAVFTGEQCKIEINRNKFTTNPPDFVKNPPPAEKAEVWEGPGWIARPHLQNWLDCIKTRSRPNADVEIGHRSVSVCHLANIVREVGRKLQWDPQNERFVADDEANRLVERTPRKGYELPPVA